MLSRFVVSRIFAVIGAYLLLLHCHFFFFFLFLSVCNTWNARHVLSLPKCLTLLVCFVILTFKTQATHRNGAAFVKPIVHSEQQGSEIFSPHTLLSLCSGLVLHFQRYDCAFYFVFVVAVILFVVWEQFLTAIRPLFIIKYIRSFGVFLSAFPLAPNVHLNKERLRRSHYLKVYFRTQHWPPSFLIRSTYVSCQDTWTRWIL